MMKTVWRFEGLALSFAEAVPWRRLTLDGEYSQPLGCEQSSLM